jgi:hypothetical protein
VAAGKGRSGNEDGPLHDLPDWHFKGKHQKRKCNPLLIQLQMEELLQKRKLNEDGRSRESKLLNELKDFGKIWRRISRKETGSNSIRTLEFTSLLTVLAIDQQLFWRIS